MKSDEIQIPLPPLSKWKLMYMLEHWESQSPEVKKSSRRFKGKHQSRVLKVGEIPSCLWAVIQALRLCPYILLTILVLSLWYLIPRSVISTFCSQVFPLNNTPFRKRYVFELSASTLFWQKLSLLRFKSIC